MLMKVFAKLGAGNGVGERAILLACHHQTTAQSAPSGLGWPLRGPQCHVEDILMEVAGSRGKARCHGKEDIGRFI